jgi:hypothetical protein
MGSSLADLEPPDLAQAFRSHKTRLFGLRDAFMSLERTISLLFFAVNAVIKWLVRPRLR